ncbi:Myb/SANT-like DNA-binding domain protein [Rhynchospora pubera]|uniref:Myb/SANT-like DNA-binding domain protein n=1 Tax=Rhynchospora pubera TaxID=906938 RepID=A0AAV8GRF8_9POAL|nr:Myb/SANT-like DNA-binding domain protein [Rhynchospora pubera]
MELDGMLGEHASIEVQHDEKAMDGCYLAWTKPMDTFLLEVLREQQLKGLKGDSGFQASAYRKAMEEINTKFNLKINKEKIQNRLKTLKDIMNLTLDALKKSGLTWSESTKKVQAAPQVWDDLVKANPKMRRIRDKEICNFSLLCDIFEKNRASGGIAKTCKERLQQWEEEALTINDVDRLQEENVVVLDNFDNLTSGTQNGVANGASSSSKTTKRSSKLGVKRKFDEVESRSATIQRQYDEGLMIVRDSLSEIGRQLAVANEYFLKSNTRVYTPEEIYAEVQKLGLSDDNMLGVVDLLMYDNKKAGSFFGCPDELKGRWLQRNGC